MLSIIVPIYNGEQYIDRCVGSLLRQNTDEIEIVLVDDGSTDNTPNICDKYAAEHRHIHVIHKENGGVPTARNAGIAAAQGAYIAFVDADDYVDDITCRELIETIRAHNPDCIDFGWKYVSRSGEIHHNLHKLPKNTLLSRSFIEDMILPPLLNLRKDTDNFIYDFSCTKIFKTEILRKYQIHFNDTRRVWEDRPFVIHYLKFCSSFYSADQCYYNYCDVPGSLSRRYSLQFFDIILDNFHFYRQQFGDRYDFDTPYVNTYWANSIQNMIFRSLEQRENAEQIRLNILKTLSDPQVVHWFQNREPENKFEHKLSHSVKNGHLERALSLCRRQRSYIAAYQLLSRIKNTLSKHLKG